MYVLKFCEKLILKDVDRNSKLPQIIVKNIMRQLLGALDHLHSHNIVHGDLKEENVLMTDNGSCKIIDFGHSRRVLSGPPDYRSGAGKWEQVRYDLKNDWVYEIYGTHELSAPEMMPNVDRRNAVKLAGDASLVPPHPGTCQLLQQWRQAQASKGVEVDKRTIPRFSGYEADVWAIGLMMFGMLHGRLPTDHSKLMRCRSVVFAGFGASEGVADVYPGLMNPLLEHGTFHWFFCN
jgi:serine/threonine protein kinase